jgi:FtsP/CotA-like multicopper oxidase with cupredoxin domain
VTLVLEPRATRWTPVPGDLALARPVLAWAEPGRAPEVPGPLVRARIGDTLRLTVRNPLARTLHVAGLADRARADWERDTIHVAPGDSAVRVVPLTRAGGFWYDAVTSAPDDPPPRPDNPFPDKHHAADETLVGAFVVDPADAPADVARRERVFVLHVGAGPSAPTLDTLLARRGQLPDNAVYVNGAAWPATERLQYTVGDTVRWRLINVAFLPHPMHLHGFYFRVDARGDASRDTVYAPGHRRMAVTELLDGFTSAQLTWVPEREGNWLFHCHLLRHMAPFRAPPSVRPRVQALAARLSAQGSPGERAPAPDAASEPGAHASAHAQTVGALAHGPTTPHDPTAHARDHMAGLVLGIHVAPAPRGVVQPVRGAPTRVRALDLWVTARDSSATEPPGYGYVLQQGRTPPARDSVQRPGTPLHLTRGEPVAITVHNTRAVPIAVHWHGMELESRYDGVGGWSGTMRSVTPAIAPGDSFIVRFTPLRAGTFIYHTHDEAGPDLAGGLYGALVVHAPGATPDPARDHLVVLGAGTVPAGPRQPPVPFVNADTGTTPLALAGAGANRLRLINIADSDLKLVRLVDVAGAPLRWRIVGKDGWTPPRRQQVARAASLLVGVGETYDVEVSPPDAARAAALLVETRYYPGTPRVRVHEARVPVRMQSPPQGRR